MDKYTPRTIIKGILHATGTQRSKSSPRSGPRTRRMSSFQEVDNHTFANDDQPISTSKVSSSVKRSAQRSVPRSAKRQRRFPTPSENFTPRTNIRTYLDTANTETPAQPGGYSKLNTDPSSVELNTQGQLQEQLRSVVTHHQVERLIRHSLPQRRSPRRNGNQNFSMPKETITPHQTIKTFRKAAETEVQTRRSTPHRQLVMNEDENRMEPSEPNADITSANLYENKDPSEHVQNKDPSQYSKIDLYEDEGKSIDDAAHEIKFHHSKEDAFEKDGEDAAQANVADFSKDVLGFSSDITTRNDFEGHTTTLVTPKLPDVTIDKATPIVLGNNIRTNSQMKNARNTKKVTRKTNQRKNTNTRSKRSTDRFPSSLIKGIFCHFSAMKVTKEAVEAVQLGSDSFFQNVAMDLVSFCKHGKRKTIVESDVELLMRRQGLVRSKESFYALLEKYLPMEYRREIIPSAKSGNKVEPKKKT